MTLLLTRSDVRELLDMPACIAAVEGAFKAQATGATFGPGVLATHVHGGGFHVKAAGLNGPPAYYVAKINANLPANAERFGLPTIQGVAVLFDAQQGRVLAVMDSMELTSLRTAAASAVAARHLSRADSTVLAIIGCGVQGRSHLLALTAVRSFTRVLVHDNDSSRSAAFAADLSGAANVEIECVRDVMTAVRHADVIATCTPGREQLLGLGDLRPGAFLAAVGADNDTKRELDPRLLADSVVIVDSLEQCAAIGELHHALSRDLMSTQHVRAELPDVVAGKRPGRASDGETIVFDSTGTALEDAAAAAVVYERACAQSVGRRISFGS